MIVKSFQHGQKIPDHELPDLEIEVADPLGDPDRMLENEMDFNGGFGPAPLKVEGMAADSLTGEILGPSEDFPEGPAFTENLADWLTEDARKKLASDCTTWLDADKQSRDRWERTYTDGLDLLGIKIEDRSQPWQGSCGVTHPMILESAVRFQSKASVRLFPARGPAMVRVYGRQDQETLEASRRVADDLNYYCLEKMPEFYPDTEQLLISLAIMGSAFRKVYHDPVLNRPSAVFIPATDFFMPAEFPHLQSCPRYTQRLRMSSADVARMQAQGYYRECELQPSPVEQTSSEQKESEISGIEPASDHNELVTLYEMHTDLSFAEFPEDAPVPYVITWEEKSQEVLGVYRNWREEDSQRRKILSFAHYRYVPGLDNYGWGLIHLIGGLTKSTTSILRQLIDAGTLSNLPGGFKARSLRIKIDDEPVAPGEWRDVDIAGGKIADSLYPFPYKEPSATLFQLLQLLIQEGKEFASIADLDISASSANAPVGTMLALIERSAEVITAVQARLHQTFKGELNLIADCIRRYDSDQGYDYPPATGQQDDKAGDYARVWAIRPVADPSAATTAQRVMQLQAAMQFSAQAPQIYDIPALHRQMLATLGIDPPEDLIPAEEARPMDPVSENMAMTNSKPVKAYEYQDHKAHLASHGSYMQDPQLQQMLSQSTLGPAVKGAFDAHMAEHAAFDYRADLEKQLGVPLPPLGEELPPEVERQISAIEAAAGGKLAQARAAQAQQAQQAQQQQDPMYQIEQQRLKLEAARVAEDQRAAQAKEAIEQQKLASNTQRDAVHAQLEQQKAQTETQKQQAQTAKINADTQAQAAKVAIDHEEIALEQAKQQSADTVSAEKLALDNERLRAEVLRIRGELETAQRKLALEAKRVALEDEKVGIEQQNADTKAKQAARPPRPPREGPR